MNLPDLGAVTYAIVVFRIHAVSYMYQDYMKTRRKILDWTVNKSD